MKVFISSVIAGFEENRAAARAGVESLGHTVIAAEDFGASADSPQQVCLAGVREADAVVLVLGERYGTPQASGLSPTHEEYREARGNKPVLVFFQIGVTPDADEAKLIEEVSGWEGVPYREPFDSPSSLRIAVTRALHRWELSQQAGPVDETALVARASALLPRPSTYTAGSPLLHVVVAGGPAQQVLRPSELDDDALRQAVEQEAIYGAQSIFDRGQGVQANVNEMTLIVSQRHAEITLDEQGSVRVSLPARDAGGQPGTAIPSIVEEDVQERVAAAIHYAGWLLNRIDSAYRLSRVAVGCRLDGAGYMPWRTRAEVAASPDRADMNLSGRESAESPPVVLARAALLLDTARQAQDITVRLRRQAIRR
jgi:Domain of unknown function (DUF4062)